MSRFLGRIFELNSGRGPLTDFSSCENHFPDPFLIAVPSCSHTTSVKSTWPPVSPWCLVCGPPIFWQQHKNTVFHLCLCVWFTACCDYDLMLVLMEVRAPSLGQDVRCWKAGCNKCLVVEISCTCTWPRTAREIDSIWLLWFGVSDTVR